MFISHGLSLWRKIGINNGKFSHYVKWQLGRGVNSDSRLMSELILVSLKINFHRFLLLLRINVEDAYDGGNQSKMDGSL